MNSLIEWFARHHIAANMLVMATIICSFIVAREIPKEIIPHIEPGTVTITTGLAGASPELVESSLCTPIESAIKPLAGIEHIRSSSLSNQCIVNVELASSTEVKKTIADINAILDLLNLPALASKPLIINTFRDVMVMRLSVSGLTDYSSLQTTAERVANDLKALGINQVNVIEAKKQQLAIEISQARLQQYQISLAEISNVLRQNALSIPGGHITSGNGISSVTISGEQDKMAELGNIVIRSLPDGSQLRLADIATLQKQYSNLEARVNGKPAIAIAIYQGNSNDLFDISDTVQDYISKAQKTLPQDVSLEVVFDNAQFFNGRMNYLKSNFFNGLAISSIILLIWLRLRLAFWITADIPIAFGGGLIWLYLMGGSINMVSAFGLIIVLGIVCDDAIVIGENVYRHQCTGKPGLEGAIAGTQEVAKTVVFAVSTTVLMFIPLLFVPGSEGKLMQPLPLIVIAILIASLIEALLVLPTHLAHYRTDKPPSSLGYAVAEKMDKLVLNYYRPLLATALQWRYSVIVICTSIFIISISLLLSGTVKVHFFSAIETEIATGAVSFPHSSDIEKTRDAVARMEQAALQLKQELHNEFGIEQIELVRTFIAENSTHGEVYLSLAKSGKRKMEGETIMQRWRDLTGNINGPSELSFHSTFAIDSAVFNILLHGNDRLALSRASSALKQQLQQYPGLFNIRDSFSQTHEEIRLQLKPDAFALGLNLQTVAAQVHMALEGSSLQDNSGKAMILKLPDAETGSLWQLENLPIQLGPLQTVPLMTIVDISHASSPDSILHVDGQQVSVVSAELDENIINANALLQKVEHDFLQNLDKNFPGVGWKKTGALEAEMKIRHYLTISFVLSLVAMFILLAIFLNSYYQPFMIFTAIPFGIVGALLGHLVFGQQLTLWSIAGMIAVSGIVVNNNMVIIFFINDRIKAGHDFTETILLAGSERFRPIMLTTITTFVGVFPTIIDSSWEAQFLIPLAISIGCGVLFAAVLTLFLVPCIYLVSNDIRPGWTEKRLKAGLS